MKRKLHIAGKGPDDGIRIADASGKVICTLPRTEERLARFIVRCVNLFGFGLRPYDRSDWIRERNREIECRYVSPDSNLLKTGGYQPRPWDGPRPTPPVTGSGVIPPSARNA